MRNKIKYLLIISLSLIVGWLLNDIWEKYRKPPFSDSSQSFDQFYHIFSSDSTYQKRRIRLPLPYKIWIAEQYELYREETWMQWKYVSLPTNIETILYDNFEGEMTGGRRLLIHNNTFYYFEFQKHSWYLIKIDKFI